MSTREGSQNQFGGSKASSKERRGRRVRVDCKLFIFGEDDFEAEARVLDLSAGGCSAESTVPLQVGMELRLSLFLKDQRWPIKIEGAVVRWVFEQKFGIEFFKVMPAVQDRIRQFIRNRKGHDV